MSLAEQLAHLLVKRSTDFVGLVETKSNAVWDNPITKASEKEQSDWLRKEMARFRGWELGAPYCVAFDGAIVADCLSKLNVKPDTFVAAWTAHVMTNVRMLKKRAMLSVYPQIGSVWLARFSGTDSGHAGIVCAITDRYITTIEANTVKPGVGGDAAQRAGDGIWIRIFSQKGRGKLQTQGFCTCDALLRLATPTT